VNVSGLLPVLAMLACTGVSRSTPPPPQVASNAPPDRPIFATDTSRSDSLQRLLQPCSARARETYPEAKRRYLHGLPVGQSFFVTIALRDNDGRVEEVFVVVDEIKDGSIRGRIWNDIHIVHGFHNGQPLVVPEGSVRDWTITHPDGTEEGNFRGKAVDQLQAGRMPVC